MGIKIENIGIDNSCRGKHLATNMIKRALTVLNDKYDVLRLFVTVVNPAQSVYYQLGFVPGAEFKRFDIPAKNN